MPSQKYITSVSLKYKGKKLEKLLGVFYKYFIDIEIYPNYP